MRERPILMSGPLVRAVLEGPRRSKLYAPRGTPTDAPEHLARRLANGIRIDESSGCWVWRRSLNGAGYGTLTVNGRSTYAHRLAYRLGVGEIPDGLDVMHECDNPPCINPTHLRAGTRAQNMKDCFVRGRSNIPVPSWPGELNAASKLTELQVAEIRRRLKAGEVQRVIAQDFGVSQSTVSDIGRGRSWALTFEREVTP